MASADCLQLASNVGFVLAFFARSDQLFLI
jgi:hypothetical protein